MPKHEMLDSLFEVMNGEPSYPFKRQRNTGSSSLLASTGVSALTDNAHLHLCQNSDCTATINPGDKLCKRCSCCICFKYDDNKDPTLWLFCNSDSCGFSCHLECAIEDERSGIQQSGQSKKLDGDYCCTQCGKQNGLLRCLEKQLMIAKDARRLDVLCHRIFLSYKILISTKNYMVLHDIVDTAMKKIESEVGPIIGIRDMGHGLVGRLAVGAEVQKLCIRAIEAVQSLFSGSLTANFPIQRSCITHCSVPPSKSQISNVGDVAESKVCVVEKSPGVSSAAFDEGQEIPRSNVQVGLSRNSSRLMTYNRGTLKRNLAMIFTGLEITTLVRSGNMLVDPPEDHVPQDRYLNAETDIESSSRFEDGRHERLADPCSTVQTSLHRESSNLMLNSRETFQQSLNADAIRLENSSDAHNENELACQKTRNEIKSGNVISGTSSKLKSCNHIHETSLSYAQREIIACNQPAPGQDLATSVSPSFSGTADSITKVASPEVALTGGPSHTMMINTHESEWRELCDHVIKECGRLELLAYEMGKREVEAYSEAEAVRLTKELETAGREKANAFIKTKSIEGQMKVLKDQVEQLNKEIEHASQTHEQMKKSYEGEKKALEDLVNQMNQRIEEASRALELEKTIVEKATQEKKALEDQVNQLNQRIEEASRELELEKTIVEKATQEKKALADHVNQLNQKTEEASQALELEKTVPESSSNKSLSGKPEEGSRGNSEASYKYCVKVIRRLECKKYIEVNFRLKFLTWFCLRAMPHEKRIVSVYVDTLINDPGSLAAQLADTFSDAIYNRLHRVPSGSAENTGVESSF